MRASLSLSLLLLVVLSCCASHAQQATTLMGCLSQDADGALHLQAHPSRTIYLLKGGEIAALQRSINQQLEARGQVSTSGATPVFSVQDFRVLSEDCVSLAPSSETFQVPGKSGPVETATPVTSVGSSGDTTAGFQTETGLEQASNPQLAHREPPGKNPGSRAFGPAYPEQAGQNAYAAEVNAQAASRAELYPGTILAVDITTAPPSSVASQQQQSSSSSQSPK